MSGGGDFGRAAARAAVRAVIGSGKGATGGGGAKRWQRRRQQWAPRAQRRWWGSERWRAAPGAGRGGGLRLRARRLRAAGWRRLSGPVAVAAVSPSSRLLVWGRRRSSGGRPARGGGSRVGTGSTLQGRDERCVSCTTFNILAPIYKRMDSEVSRIFLPLSLESTQFSVFGRTSCWGFLDWWSDGSVGVRARIAGRASTGTTLFPPFSMGLICGTAGGYTIHISASAKKFEWWQEYKCLLSHEMAIRRPYYCMQVILLLNFIYGNRTMQKRLDRFVCKLADFKIDGIEMIGKEAIPGVSYYKEKKNVIIGVALSGALISAASNNHTMIQKLSWVFTPERSSAG